MTLVQGPIKLGVLFGREDLPSVHVGFRIPRDPPPLDLSFKSIVLDDLTYVTSSFDTYMDTSKDYAIGFAESSTGPIIGDVLVSGSGVLGGIVHAQVDSKAEWRLRAKALQVRVTELEITTTARKVPI